MSRTYRRTKRGDTELRRVQRRARMHDTGAASLLGYYTNDAWDNGPADSPAVQQSYYEKAWDTACFVDFLLGRGR